MPSVWKQKKSIGWFAGVMGFTINGKRKQLKIELPISRVESREEALRIANELGRCIKYLEGRDNELERFHGARARDYAINQLETWNAISHNQAEELRSTGRIVSIAKKGGDPVLQRSDIATLGVAVAEYLSHQRSWLRPRTLTTYTMQLNHLIRFAGTSTAVRAAMSKQGLIALEEWRTRALKSSSKSKDGARSINQLREALSAFASYLLDRDLIGANIVRKTIKKRRVATNALDFYNEEDVQKLLEAARNLAPAMAHRSRVQWAVAIRLLVETGIRLEELLHLQWNDIDIVGRHLHVRAKMGWKPKNGNDRCLPLSTTLTDQLAAWKDALPLSFAHGEAWLITWGKKDKYARCRVKDPGKQLARIHTTAGIPWHGFHTFRHTFAIRMVDLGLNPRQVQALLDHASLSTTEIYFKRDNRERLFEQVRTLLNQ